MPNAANLALDLRFALRQLRRSPGFAATGVLTLALAISAACVTFSLVHAVLLQPLRFPEADHLVGIGLDQPGGAPISKQTGQTAQFLIDHARSFSSFGLLDRRSHELNFSTGKGQPTSVRALGISEGYLRTLHVEPLLGRNFSPAEDTSGAANVVLLSETLWRSALGGDSGVIGRVVRVNGDPATVVGILPGGFATMDTPDLWLPLRMSPKDPGYQGTNYDLYARLRPGVTVPQANAELNTLGPAMLREFPPLRSWDKVGPPVTETAYPLQTVIAADARPGLVALTAAVSAVLIIACLNLAALMTARSAVRSSELAVRVALGASRGSLLRLMFAESLLLASAGAVLGLGGAYAGMPYLLHYAPIQLPAFASTSIDLRTAAFAVAAGFAAALLSGLLPAMATARTQSGIVLGSGRNVSGTPARQRIGRSLLVAQVALATALLAVGFVLLGTFVELRASTPGVLPEHLDVLQVQLQGQRYTSATRTQQFIETAEQRLSSLPGIQSAAAVYGLPLDRNLNGSEGPANNPALIQYAQFLFVTPGYFSTVGTSLVQGHDVSFGTTQRTEPIGLINEFAAKRWFGDSGKALDRIIVDGAGAKTRVVGVVAPVHLSSLADTQSPTVYLPIAQMDDRMAATMNGWFPVSFTLRVRPVQGADPDLAHAGAAIITSIDPDVAVSKFVPMQSFVDESYAAPRFYSWLAGGFACFSLSLTVIGLFGLMSYQVASRTREIGVRMAVGARRGQVAGLVLLRGLRLTGTGLLLGLGLGIALQAPLLGFLAGALGVSPEEASSVLTSRLSALTLTSLLMLLAAAAACLFPARHAASVQPTEALRAE